MAGTSSGPHFAKSSAVHPTVLSVKTWGMVLKCLMASHGVMPVFLPEAASVLGKIQVFQGAEARRSAMIWPVLVWAQKLELAEDDDDDPEKAELFELHPVASA